MDASDLIPISQLEQELGMSRVDLLLLLRRLGIQPVRRGLRTLLRRQQAEKLVEHLSGGSALEAVQAELLPEASGADALPVPVNPMWGDAARFAELRLLRERLELLELLVRSGIELDSRQLCELLELRRLPPTQSWEGGSQGFERQGLRFVRHQRPGQRTGWRTVRP